MKIALDARAATARPGGVGTYTRNLIAGLAKLGGDDEIHLVSHRPIQLDVAPPARFRLWDRPRPIGNLWLQTTCARYLRRARIDVFHGANFLAPLASPCPTVLTVHDLSSFLLPAMHAWRNNLVQRLLPAAIRRAARVIAISERTQADLIAQLRVPAAKIRVVYNAIAECFAPLADQPARTAARRRLDLPERYFLYVGVLERRKNIAGLLKAFAKFARANGNGWRLLLAGPDGLGAAEARLLHRQLGLGDHARFLGYVPAEDLPALYSLARALVFPSVFEGFGLPPVEAMACGTPALVADGSALAEVVGDAAVKVSPNDVDALAGRLAALAGDDRLWADRSAAGRERARRYNLDDFARRTLAVYREAVEDRPA